LQSLASKVLHYFDNPEEESNDDDEDDDKQQDQQLDNSTKLSSDKSNSQ